MKNPFRSTAQAVLASTSTADGKSTLPDWLLTPLAIVAGSDNIGGSVESWTDESLLHKAIGLYRAASARSTRPAPLNWQFSLNGTQAIQVLPPAQDTLQEQAFLQFSRRLEAVTLNHPRMAPILNAAIEQGYPFLAARIGAGFESLTRRLKLPLEPKRAMQIAEQVSSALEHAHYRGLFHGALDLQDILINDEGQTSLLGVGVTQLRQHLGAGSEVILTPLLPPEVATGEQLPGVSSDVFATSALLYILLTSRVPAAGQQVTLSQTIPEVPVALDAVMTKALAFAPADRYASLLEMNRDLRVALRAPRAIARPSAPAQRRAEAPARRLPTSRSVMPAAGRSASTNTPDNFPEPLPMPEIDMSSMQQVLVMPEVEMLATIEIPPAPEIPRVDWLELLQPIDVSSLSSQILVPPTETLAPDPLVAAAMAVKSAEQNLQNRQRAARKPAAPTALTVPAVEPNTAPQPAASSSNKRPPTRARPAGRARPSRQRD